MVISDCNVAWKDKIRKTTFQEEVVAGDIK